MEGQDHGRGSEWEAIASANLAVGSGGSLVNDRNWQGRCWEPHNGGGGWEVVVYDGEDIPGSVAAQTWTCPNSSTIRYAEVRFDRINILGDPRRWFTGSVGSAIDDNAVDLEYDLQSFITHEFGHVAGTFSGGPNSGHYVDSATYCNLQAVGGADGDYETMCEFFASEEWEWRTTEAHDQHTLQNHY